MRLDQWLARTKETRSGFARRVGLSPAAITALCNDPGVWVSRETAEKIASATRGAVTPDDFLGLDTKSRAREETMMNQSRVAAALRAFERGEIVVVTDDDDRENEGDLIVAAVHATPEKLAFIVRHTSGIVCTPIPRDLARKLHLEPMIAANDAPLGTAFTVTIDYRHGLTTGISAEERCNTARALANPNVGPADFVRPGHVFPLIAKDGGVLMRSGHTEAAVDLCRLAGLPPVGVICELVNDDGTVKRGPDVAKFAEEHGLAIVSVADLIAYRQRNERLVERVVVDQLDGRGVGNSEGVALGGLQLVEHLVDLLGEQGGLFLFEGDGHESSLGAGLQVERALPWSSDGSDHQSIRPRELMDDCRHGHSLEAEFVRWPIAAISHSWRRPVRPRTK